VLLPGNKQSIAFGQAQGVNFHRQPSGRRLTHTLMPDWLAHYLPAGEARDSMKPLKFSKSYPDKVTHRQPTAGAPAGG
jgi:hypothetical protein